MSIKHAVLHVVQADAGDAFVLEFNSNLTGTNDNTYILIDGGPPEVAHGEKPRSKAKANLYTLLNTLSGSTVNGDTAPKKPMKKIDTLILTNDDEDHREGIVSLISSLIKKKDQKKGKDELMNTWVLGDETISQGKSPIEHIWYNSLEDITKCRVSEGIPVTKNWFDEQLQQYNGLIQTRMTFNADLGTTSSGSKTGRFAVAGAQGSSGKLKRDQFEFEFIGPLWNQLMSNGLLQVLARPKTIPLPSYKFTQNTLAKSATTKLAGNTLNEPNKREIDQVLKASQATSDKSKSSIAFIISDGDTKVLLLGDGVASMLKKMYIGTPIKFTVMKVMNHGSKLSNYWTRDAARKAEEANVPVIQENNFDSFQLDVIFFFAKVRAKKYIISASSDGPQPNPHITTLIGIIAAAQETLTDVEIYLTNPLPDTVLKKIGDLFSASDSKDISFVTIYQLNSTSYSGAIAIYDHEEDSSDWTPYAAKDLTSTYPEKFEEANSGVSAASLSGTLAVAKGSVDISVITSKLLGISTPTSYEELSSYAPYPTRNVTDLSELLKYLVSEGDMKQEDVTTVQSEIVVDDGLKMGPLLGLLMGVRESERVLSALPFDLGDTPDYLDQPDSPSEWIVSGFSAKVIDPPNSDHHGKKGIFSITFVIPARPAALTWKIPLAAKFAPDPYYILYDDAISVQVIWPCYTMGISSSRFPGQLVTATKSYNAMIESVVVAGQPTIYTVRFADEKYNVDNFKMSLVDLARVFGTNVEYGEVLTYMILPGIEAVLKDLDINVGLNNCGFTMHKDLSTFTVYDMFAEEKLDLSWNPFSSAFNLSLKTLRVVVENLYSSDTRKIFIKLLGGTSISNLNLPFEFTAEYTPQKTMLYQLALLPGISDSLSVGTIGDLIGLSDAIDLSKTFPAVSNLSNALSVSHVVLGWIKDQAKPASLSLIVRLDKWVLSQNVFEIGQIMVDIEVKNLSDSATREFLLRGWGIVTIADIDLEAFFDYSHYAEAAKNDEIYFQVGTKAKPIPLGSILLHFLGKGVDVLPNELASILEETKMDNCIIQAEKADNKWSLKKVQLTISVTKDINIFEGIKVSSPTMTIKVDNPFDTASRTIYVGIDAQVHVADVVCKVTFVVASAEKSIITMTLDAGESPLTAQTLLSQFLPNIDWISLPESLTFLASIGIKQASLTLERNSGKFSMSEITITAVSTTSLQLWEELSLKQVTLLVSHSKYDGNKVELDAMLTLNKKEDYLGFTIAYSAPPGTKSSGTSSSVPDSSVSAETTPGAVWSASASYQGDLSVLDVLSDMSGLQLRDILGKIDLPVLTNALDIEISKLQVALTHDSTKSSFSFDADLDWLCFSHLRFALAKTSVWEYSLGFAIGSADKNILEDIPALGPIIGAQVAMEHLTVVVYNYELNAGALDPVLQIPHKSSGGNITLAIATRLVFKGVLEDMTKVVGVGTLDIVGTINSQEVTLTASIGQPITLFNGKLTLSGSVVVESKLTVLAPKIGVQGDAVLDFGSHISSEPIRITLMLLVDTSIGGLGFKFTLDKWHSVFGFPGLDIDNVVFGATFPPQQFPVPSEFTIKGTVKLAVNNAGIGGSINVHVVENDLTSSYATGDITGLNLSNLIQVFADVPSPPGYLDGGFGPLEFALVPKNTVDVSGKPLSQQFKLSGSFKMPIIPWEARILIDITPRKVTIDGHLDPINPFGIKKLFSILASDDDPEGEDAGASIKVHINDETSPFYASVTGKFTFLGIRKEINFEVSQRGLELLLAQDVWTNKGSLQATIDDTHMQIVASYQYALDLMIPNFSVGGFKFEITRIIGFGAAFDLDVNWKKIGWKLKVSGSFELFTLKIAKSFEFGFDIQDLEALGKKIVEFIVKTIGEDFIAALKAILSSISKVIDVLKVAGMKVVDIIKFLVEQLGVAMEIAIRAVKEFFNMAWEEIVKIMKSLGQVAEAIVDTLKKIGVAAWDIAVGIGKAFGEAVRDLCTALLKGAGRLASEIASFFRDIFHDVGQAIVDILVEFGHDVWQIVGGIASAIAAPFEAIWNWITGSTPKRTRAQVEQELLLTLMVRVNETLSERVEIQSKEDLDVIMRRCALERFERNFGYKYDGTSSKPPLSQDPGAVSAAENQMSYTDGNNGHVTEYINGILRGLDLEAWMKDRASADLKEELQDLLGVVPTAFWQVSALEKTYHPSNPEQNPVRLNGIVLFVNGKLSLDGHTVTNTMSFFLGAYYQVPPPTVLARRALQAKAYTSVPEAPPLTVIDDTSLTSALTTYASKQFTKEFHFNYNERPSEATNPSLFFTTLNALSYYEDKVVQGVQAYLKTKILSKSPLPDWVQDQALGDLETVYESLVVSGQQGWRNFKFDHTYTRPGESFNPINSKGIVMYYVDTQTTDEKNPVSISYIFFLGAYYESLNHASLVRQDLINELSKNLSQDMQNAPTSSKVPDYSWLQTLLARYGRDQFYRKNEYELMAQATTPPKVVKDRPLYVIEQSGEFENKNLLDKQAEAWVDSVLSSDKFSPVKSDSTIRQDMIDSIKYKLAASVGFEDNHWTVTDYNKDYTYAEDGDLTVKIVGVFIHVNGRLELSGDEVKISFLHFSGVCYVENNPW